MTTTPITLEQVIDEAKRAIIVAGPGHVNPGIGEDTGCSYTDADGNHCVAGQIAVGLGVPIPPVGDPANTSHVKEVPGWTDWFSEDALDWLYSVQDLADDGFTWAECVERLERSGQA